MVCLISISSAPFACLGNKEYFDLLGTLKVMKRIWSESVVDGFELQVQPEWDRKYPPRTDRDFADWRKTPKFSVDEILDLVRSERLPILSVHASRDLGSYLCSGKEEDLNQGKKVASDALFLASELGASVCVFHMWDTWATCFNLRRLREVFHELSDGFSGVKASVENVPTHIKGFTPLALAKGFDYVTLDLRWAAMYEELDGFQPMAPKLVNIHLRGALEGNEWVLKLSPFGFYDAIHKILDAWGYSGLLTLEREGPLDSSHFAGFVEATSQLRTMTRAGDLSHV